MKNINKKLKIFTIFVLILILITSCKNKKTNEIVEKDNSDNEIVTVIKNEDFSFDPRFSNSVKSDAIISQIFEGLTEYSSHGKIANNIAENIEHNEDFTSWTITIRDNINWSDNSKIETEHFVNSWKSILKKENNNPNYYKLFFIKNAKDVYNGLKDESELGIKTVDKNKIEVNLEYPVKNFDEFLSNIFMFPVKEINFSNDNLITNGPFSIDKISEKSITLLKNNNYWDSQNTHTKKVTFLKEDNDIIAYQLFDLGQIDFIGMPFYEIPYERRQDANKRPEFLDFKTNIFEFLSLDMNNEILKNSEIRNKLDKFIDSNFIALYTLYNNSEPLYNREVLKLEDKENLKTEMEKILEKEKISTPLLKMKYNGTKLSERVLASLSKEWIDKYKIKININKDEGIIEHSMFSIGTTDKNDIKYYINHFYQNDDFSKLYENIEQIKEDNFILPLYNRNFSLLVNKKIKGLFVSPNGHLLINNITKK